MSRKKLRIGVTLGDCAGIGPEIVDLALKSRRVAKSAEYKIIGKYPRCSLGQPTTETARAAAIALEEAITLVRRGELDAIVTGPIHKARMYEVGFRFPGQTEFFAERCGVKNFTMCLTGGKLTVALVTAHIPLCKIRVAREFSSRALENCSAHRGCRTKSACRRIRQAWPRRDRNHRAGYPRVKLVTRHSSLVTRCHRSHFA